MAIFILWQSRSTKTKARYNTMLSIHDLKKSLWLILFFFGAIGFIVTWLFFPHQKQIDSIWQLLFKFVTYGFIVGAIAFFPNKSKHKHLLVILPFFVFLGYLIPRISYFGFRGVAAGNVANSGEFYTILYLLLFPLINFTTTFAYRMGKGTPGNCIKISLSGIIIIFSGFLDISWFLVNPVNIPDRLAEAYHITLFFGHPATYTEGIFFAIFHIPLLITVLLLPFDKWINSISLAFDKHFNKNTLNNMT
jgi:hypothetical protein